MKHAFRLGRPKTPTGDTAAHELIADTIGAKTMIEEIRRDSQNHLMVAVRLTGRWVMSDWPPADILIWLPATAAATMQLAIQEGCMVYGLTGLVQAEVERLERLYADQSAWGEDFDPGMGGGREDTVRINVRAVSSR